MLALPVVGDGVVIDRLRPDDAADLSRSHSDPDNARYQGWQSPLSEAEALEFIEEQSGDDAVQFAIRETRGGPLAGDLYVHREDAAADLGITLVPGFHRRGLATATIRTVVDALARDGVTRVVAWADIGNTRSRALFERAGFTVVGEHDGEVEMELVPAAPPPASQES